MRIEGSYTPTAMYCLFLSKILLCLISLIPATSRFIVKQNRKGRQKSPSINAHTRVIQFSDATSIKPAVYGPAMTRQIDRYGIVHYYLFIFRLPWLSVKFKIGKKVWTVQVWFGLPRPACLKFGPFESDLKVQLCC